MLLEKSASCFSSTLQCNFFAEINNFFIFIFAESPGFKMMMMITMETICPADVIVSAAGVEVTEPLTSLQELPFLGERK